MLLFMPIAGAIVAWVLVVLAFFLLMRANFKLTAIQRQQAQEFAQLRRAITELRQPPLSTAPDDQASGLPTIGASARVLQVGDQVEVIDGPHVGEFGTVVPSPDWVREGVVCVDLSGGQGQRYVEVSKLARWDEPGQD